MPGLSPKSGLEGVCLLESALNHQDSLRSQRICNHLKGVCVTVDLDDLMPFTFLAQNSPRAETSTGN